MFYHGRRIWGQSFQLIRQAFLQAEELPFGDLLSEETIQQAFEKENACFAKDPGDIYTPAITLWAFLSQVLHAKRLRSCVAAVSRVTVRELKVRVAIRGFRVQQLVVATTLTDAQRYPKSAIAGLFRQRWNAELDLRDVKISLQLDDLRGQTPAMVRREIWVHWLAYNLIRKTIAQAALTHEKLPCQLSFAGALAAVAASWDHATIAPRSVLAALAEAQFRLIAWHEVGHRPNRIEPRAIKRRPKPHRLLRQPRPQARAELCGLSSAP